MWKLISHVIQKLVTFVEKYLKPKTVSPAMFHDGIGKKNKKIVCVFDMFMYKVKYYNVNDNMLLIQ